MPPETEIINLLVFLILLMIEGLCLIFFALRTGLSYRLMARTWKRGLLFAGGVSLLWLPLAILAVVSVDFSAQQPDMPFAAALFARFFLAVIILFVLIALMPLRATYYHVAKVEWSGVRGDFELALAGPRRSRLLGVGAGMAAGLVNLIAALVVFHLGHVAEPPTSPELVKLFPAFSRMSPGALAFPIGCFAVGAAVVEELIFRGGILGFLLRITRNNTALAWVFIAAVALVWAFMHYPNTNSPFLKMMQIFTLGVALGAMARQWGLGSAIAGHVTLNIGAVIANVIFPGL